MRMQHVGKVTAVVGAAALLLSGCGWFGANKEAVAIDPPPASEMLATDGSQSAQNTDSTQKKAQEQLAWERTVYVLDANGFVVPLTLSLPKEKEPAKQVLLHMIKGGPIESKLPSGFKAVLPQGTKIIGMNVKDGVATVDFSKEFTKYDGKDERKIVEAISRALTEKEPS